MTHRDHLVVKKMGVKGPPNSCNKIWLPWDICEILWSKIWGSLNPHFFHHQMIPVGHMNIPTWLFLAYNFILKTPYFLRSVLFLDMYSPPPLGTGEGVKASRSDHSCHLALVLDWIVNMQPSKDKVLDLPVIYNPQRESLGLTCCFNNPQREGLGLNCWYPPREGLGLPYN